MDKKKFNSIKYKNSEDLEVLNNDKKQQTDIVENKKLISENKEIFDSIVPLNKEHLLENKIRLNKELMKKWCK